VYNDDKQITELHITKVYSTEDKITVKITEAENERELGEF
jgi:Holliday junction resolvase RusA-like endonuclease